MSWENILKEFRDSIELVEEMEDIVREFESDLMEIKSYIDSERRLAVKKDFGIPYEEVLSEFKEEIKSGMLNENALARILYNKIYNTHSSSITGLEN
tara:strand:- start:618 stop:908 length:291 start_codon:yes stop_codon:yes gene_type:complete